MVFFRGTFRTHISTGVGSIVRRCINPKGHWSEGSLFQRAIVPKGHWSENKFCWLKHYKESENSTPQNNKGVRAMITHCTYALVSFRQSSNLSPLDEPWRLYELILVIYIPLLENNCDTYIWPDDAFRFPSSGPRGNGRGRSDVNMKYFAPIY
jgi:hypothetical protein